MFNKLFLIYLALILFSGCSYRVASPPAKFSSSETPAVLKKGKSNISVDMGAYSEVFGPSLSFGSVEYSKGLGDRKELSLRPLLAMVENKYDESDLSKRLILGMSADLKTNPSRYLGRHFALFGGGGYAYSYYAQIVSAHGGFILGYDGKYFVPFISFEAFVSLPTSTKPVPGTNDMKPAELKSPTRTFGIKPVTGLKINLSKTLSIMSNAGFVIAQSQTDQLGMLHINFGAEWNFRN